MKQHFFTGKLLIHFILLKFLYLLLSGKRLKDQRRWVVITREGHLGDFLCHLSALKHFAAYYHEQEMTVALIVNPQYRELAERLLPFDQVIGVIPEKTAGIRYRIMILKQLYSMNIDTLISLGACNIAGFMETFSFAKVKHMSYMKTETEKLRRYGKYYDYRHERYCGICIQDQNERVFHDITGQTAEVELFDFRKLLPEIRLQNPPAGKYYLVLAGASGREHCWAADHFAFLIRAVQKDFPEYTAVLLGSSPCDHEISREIISAIEDRSHLLDLCGKNGSENLFRLDAGCFFCNRKRFRRNSFGGGLEYSVVFHPSRRRFRQFSAEPILCAKPVFLPPDELFQLHGPLY